MNILDIWLLNLTLILHILLVDLEQQTAASSHESVSCSIKSLFHVYQLTMEILIFKY